MRAMRLERADPALLVAEQDDLLAEELFLARQILQLLGEADRLPITAQEFAHRAARLDAGQLVIGWRGLPSISRFHRLPPSAPRNSRNAKCKRRAHAAVNGGPCSLSRTAGFAYVVIPGVERSEAARNP